MDTWKINDAENGEYTEIMENLNKDNAKQFLTDIANFLETLIRYISQLFKAFEIKPKYADKD
jgi:uncharacterized protein YpuA (DUF1002 family)